MIVLTTYDLDGFVYGALRAGAAGFLLRPTAPDRLVAGIQLVAAGEALLAPSLTPAAHRGARAWPRAGDGDAGGSVIERKSMPGGELHVAYANDRRLFIDQRRNRIERQRRWIVLRLDETNVRACLRRDAEPGVGNTRELQVDRDDVGATGQAAATRPLGRMPRSRSS